MFVDGESGRRSNLFNLELVKCAPNLNRRRLGQLLHFAAGMSHDLHKHTGMDGVGTFEPHLLR